MRRFFTNCVSIDSKLCIRIHKLSGKKFLDYLFYALSKIGDGWIYAIFTVVYLIFKTREALNLLPALITGFFIETGSYKLIKKNVKRIRPFKKIEEMTSLIIPPDEFSFPSGHTAAATVFAVISGIAFPQFRLLFYIYAASVGFSRVYNGVHYPGDVFAGAALGFFSAKIGLLIF